MAIRRSKKKRPQKSKYLLKEGLKIEEGVFDERTMLRLGKMFTRKIVSKLDYGIATGKEADVYVADPGPKIDSESVIIKIFRIETSSFGNRTKYIVGDPRFKKLKPGIYHMVNEWCKKEYGNLKIAESAGVRAPRPYSFNGNVLAMEFIGSEGRASQKLKDVILENPSETLRLILDDIKKLYDAKLVHGDVSEYNILMKDNLPYLIDFGQAVILKHPNANSFLERDLSNILSFFSRKYNIEMDLDETLRAITSG
jgi:RIO kinase 1